MTETEKSQGILRMAEAMRTTYESVGKLFAEAADLLSRPGSAKVPGFVRVEYYADLSAKPERSGRLLAAYSGISLVPSRSKGCKTGRVHGKEPFIVLVANYCNPRDKTLIDSAELWFAVCELPVTPRYSYTSSRVSVESVPDWEDQTLPKYGEWHQTVDHRQDPRYGGDLKFTMSRQPLCILENTDKLAALVVEPLLKEYACLI